MVRSKKMKKKKVSSQNKDLEDKFARMCITTPSSSLSSQTSDVSRNKASLSAKAPHRKKTTPNKSSSSQGGVTGKRKTAFKEYEHGYAPVVPPSLYDCLQEIVGYVKYLETHEDNYYIQTKLAEAECGVEVFADYYKEELPKDWKYDRATAGKWKQIPYFYR